MNEIKVMKQLKAFIRSVTSVEAFAHKVKLLTESDPKKLQMLFAHSRKGTQYKTDQNFYFLWVMLYQLDFDFIDHNRDKTFVTIFKMYELIQKSPKNFTVSTFFDEMENCSQKITQS